MARTGTNRRGLSSPRRKPQTRQDMLEEARMALSLPSLNAAEQAPIAPPSPPLFTSYFQHQSSSHKTTQTRKSHAAFDHSDVSTVASTRSSASFWSRRKQQNRKKKQQLQQQHMVANFFDVQSVRKKEQRQRYMESQSVTSQANSVSTLGRIFRFMKWNDEIDGLEEHQDDASSTPPIQLDEYLNLDEEDAFTIDDEELTMASGLEVEDESSVMSWNSFNNNNNNNAPREMMSRDQEKRNNNNKQSLIRKLLTSRRRNLAKKNQEQKQVSSSKSVGDYREDFRYGLSQPYPRSTSERWLKAREVTSASNFRGGQQSITDETTTRVFQRQRSTPIISVRTLKSEETKATETSDNQDREEVHDDDSIMSLLSGLLTSWTAEQDSNKIVPKTIIYQKVDVDSEECPKSILKSDTLMLRTANDDEMKEEQDSNVPVRNVVFGKVEIREYERVVGDNPSCSRGPPISIGWNYQLVAKYAIDEYEAAVRKLPPRSKREFYLPANRRTEILIMEWQYSEDEIGKARREATYIQYCRAKTSFSGTRVAAKEAAALLKSSSNSFPDLPSPKSPPKCTVSMKRLGTAPVSLHNSPKPSSRTFASALSLRPVGPLMEV